MVNTILVVGVAGSHQTGYDDDLISINSLLEELEQINGWNIPLHIDAALSGFIYPFIYVAIICGTFLTE